MDVAETRGHFEVMNAILEYFTYSTIGANGVDINAKLGMLG